MPQDHLRLDPEHNMPTISNATRNLKIDEAIRKGIEENGLQIKKIVATDRSSKVKPKQDIHFGNTSQSSKIITEICDLKIGMKVVHRNYGNVIIHDIAPDGRLGLKENKEGGKHLGGWKSPVGLIVNGVIIQDAIGWKRGKDFKIRGAGEIRERLIKALTQITLETTSETPPSPEQPKRQ